MNKIEWDKCFIWLAAMFPQWNTTAATSAVWYDELGRHVEAKHFQSAVRITMAHDPKPFPPGVFELKAVFQAEDTLPPGDMLWEQIWSGATVIDDLPLQAKKALEAMGGIERLRMMDLKDLKFQKKTFTESYNHFCSKDISEIELSKKLMAGEKPKALPIGEIVGDILRLTTERRAQ